MWWIFTSDEQRNWAPIAASLWPKKSARSSNKLQCSHVSNMYFNILIYTFICFIKQWEEWLYHVLFIVWMQLPYLLIRRIFPFLVRSSLFWFLRCTVFLLKISADIPCSPCQKFLKASGISLDYLNSNPALWHICSLSKGRMQIMTYIVVYIVIYVRKLSSYDTQMFFYTVM